MRNTTYSAKSHLHNQRLLIKSDIVLAHHIHIMSMRPDLLGHQGTAVHNGVHCDRQWWLIKADVAMKNNNCFVDWCNFFPALINDMCN